MAEQLTITEYDPSLLMRASGYIGSLSVRSGEAPPAEADYAGPPLNEVLDGVIGQGPLSADEAHLVIRALHASPRLKAPLFVQGLPISDRIAALSADAGPVYLPTSNFVYAAGMADWVHGHGRRVDDRLTGNQLIRSYARKRSTPPPISFVSVDVQPDGLALYSSVHDGGHRVAAAHLRGDPFVPVGSNITIRRLPRNVVPPKYWAQS